MYVKINNKYVVCVSAVWINQVTHLIHAGKPQGNEVVMPKYLLIESGDPFDGNDVDFLPKLASSLALGRQSALAPRGVA